MKTLIIMYWKKEKERRVCLYVGAVTRTQITRDSAGQDIVHMKETRSGKKRVDLFMQAWQLKEALENQCIWTRHTPMR